MLNTLCERDVFLFYGFYFITPYGISSHNPSPPVPNRVPRRQYRTTINFRVLNQPIHARHVDADWLVQSPPALLNSSLVSMELFIS